MTDAAVNRRRGVWWAGLVVASAAAAATAHGIYAVAIASGVPAEIAVLYPVMTDGLALVAYSASNRLRGPRPPVRLDGRPRGGRALGARAGALPGRRRRARRAARGPLRDRRRARRRRSRGGAPAAPGPHDAVHRRADRRRTGRPCRTGAAGRSASGDSAPGPASGRPSIDFRTARTARTAGRSQARAASGRLGNQSCREGRSALAGRARHAAHHERARPAHRCQPRNRRNRPQRTPHQLQHPATRAPSSHRERPDRALTGCRTGPVLAASRRSPESLRHQDPEGLHT